MTGYVIDMIDVGQGDAFLIATETPQGIRNCLIDAGLSSNGQIVANHIKDHYDGKLTYAVLTHVDDDHIGGFQAVLDAKIRPQTVYVNDPREMATYQVIKKSASINEQYTQINASVATSNSIIDRIDKLNIQRKRAFAGTKLSLSSALTLRVLSPTEKQFGELVPKFTARNKRQLVEKFAARHACTAENEASVVVEATFKTQERFDNALFTGDACLKTLKMVANKPYNYVKVPHHGSAHCWSADLVAAWTSGATKARAAFSFGENNHGHPDPDVVRAFRERNAMILCTHCHGTVQSRRLGARPIGVWLPDELPECGGHSAGLQADNPPKGVPRKR